MQAAAFLRQHELSWRHAHYMKQPSLHILAASNPFSK